MDVALPKWSETMEDADIGEWLVKVGDRVTKGQPLANIETEKATLELESPAAGVVEAILAEVGQTVMVGDVLARIVTD
ncbi:MAG: lipoyl domain-containing protein [Gammaproteobacteria bacterium]|nr:lipoyl domain-containing protein [Gammaproteobacteria bacterium]